MKIIQLSYAEYGNLVTKLIDNIKKSEIQFCAVHGLMKGGLPIAVALSNALNIPLTVTLVELEVLCKDRLVLVVDDIISHATETDSFSRFIELASAKGIKYKSASLYCKLNAFRPDFYEVMINDNEWIEFPWGHSHK